jgi:hypothetical protein
VRLRCTGQHPFIIFGHIVSFIQPDRATVQATVTVSNGSIISITADPSTESDREALPFFDDNDVLATQKDIAQEATWLFPANDVPYGSGDRIGLSYSFDQFIQLLANHRPDIPLEAYLDPNVLITALKPLWRAYWVQYASKNMRVSEVTEPVTVDAVVSHTVTRIAIAPVSARVIEGLLALVLVLTIVASFSVWRRADLPKAPHSIAAQLSFLAGSKLAHLERLQSRDAHRMSDEEARSALQAFRLTLGWTTDIYGRNRFGVDFETAEEAIRRTEEKNLNE